MDGESVLRESAPDPMPPTSEASQARFATRIIPKQWSGTQTDCPDCKFCDECDWTWQLLPVGLLYKSYLAGTKESRIFGSLLYNTKDG